MMNFDRLFARPLSFSEEIVNNYVEQCDYVAITNYLKNSFPLQRSGSYQHPTWYEFSSPVIDKLLNIFQWTLRQRLDDDNVVELIAELFRSLRLYVLNPEVRDYLLQEDQFFIDVKHLINTNRNKLSSSLGIILQFLNNFIIQNKSTSAKIYHQFSETIDELLKSETCLNVTCALLYNIFMIHSEYVHDFDQYHLILRLHAEFPDVEYLHFLVDFLLKFDEFWDNYSMYDMKYRVNILNNLRVDRFIKRFLSEHAINILIRKFIDSGNVIFQIESNEDSYLAACEVSQLLSVIASVSGEEKFLKILQDRKDLLIHAGVLLINVHRLGKASENCFSPIQKLSEITRPQDEMKDSPVFGFKADLIRLVGNMCYKNNVMQDLIREAELIPAILDCCNLDAKNPFILQWAILAVRNLCENNMKNQQIIMGMHRQGTVSSSDLENMGLTLHSDGDNILKIIPLEI